ncbi:galanin receptor type 1-like [Amphiura filiformis]|uniref:galanin receptor type 1-like n=1 Tax=Amphiura filiformis TaxID=82378 RepID=UPI003B20D3A6
MNNSTISSLSENSTSILLADIPGKGGLFKSLSATDLLSVLTYWIVGTVGIIGNGLVCMVFKVIRRRRSQVNLFILNQAVADFVTSVLLVTFGTTRVFRDVIPIKGTTGEFICRFWWSRFFVFSCFAVSTFNLTTMSIERYIAVVHPLSYSIVFNYRNVIVIITLIWLIAPIMQYIFPIWMYAASSGSCIFQSSWTFTAGCISGVILFCWEYFFPCLIMSSAYIKILLTLNSKEKALKVSHEHGSSSNGAAEHHHRKTIAHKRRRNITITLFLLFIIYILCWTPNQFTFLQFNIGGPLDFNGAWYHFTVVAAFLNTTLNPFIYALKHSQFQQGLKALCKRSRKVGPSDDTANRTVVDTNETVID